MSSAVLCVNAQIRRCAERTCQCRTLRHNYPSRQMLDLVMPSSSSRLTTRVQAELTDGLQAYVEYGRKQLNFCGQSWL